MTLTDVVSDPPTASRRRSGWSGFVEPRGDGLPNARLVAIPLALLAALFVALVAFGVTGTSTGVMHSAISDSADPDLLAGGPQSMRSDEWYVQTSWTISQVEQGLPVRNETFPGGMDATVQHDLPARDWSIAFRPHLLGFLFLPLDQAMAVKWWLPGFALVAAVYLFAIALMPRRPVSSLLLAGGFFFAPFFQWWYLSITFYPAAWAFLVMATLVWSVKSRGRWGSWVLAAVTAYITVAMGTGIYVPFIVPAVFVALAFGVGYVLTRDPGDESIGRRLRRTVPLLAGAAAAVGVLVVWVVTRWATIVGFTSTVYPGERLQGVGQGTPADFDALLSGVISAGLERTGGRPFGMNSSEASTFLLVGLFLVAAIVWLIVDRFRRTGRVDWLAVSLIVLGAVMFAFMFVPGWDALAHLVLLDRTTYGRMRLGFGILSLLAIVLVAVRADERRAAGETRIPRWIAAIGAALAAVAAVRVTLLVAEEFGSAAILDQVGAMGIAAVAGVIVLFVACVYLLGRGAIVWGSSTLLVLSIGSAGLVNPVYRGVLDLRDTDMAQEIERLNAQDPGEWVGIAETPLPTMLLVETAVPSFNGFQSTPSEEMWSEIDPASEWEWVWNRLANVSWVAGEGNPQPRNPAPDQIQLTFDSCGAFAQDNVRWVIAEKPLVQSCATLVSSVTDGPTTMRFYSVDAK